MNLTDLTIVCPTAGYPDVSRSLYTFRKYAPGAKIIAIDQTPHGALDEEEIKSYTDVYMRVYKALGFSKAMNFGIALADTKFVCCVNDDVEFVNIKMWDGIGEWLDRSDVAGVNPASIKGYAQESDNLPCSCNGKIDEKNGNCLECRAYKEEYGDDDWEFFLSSRELKFSAMNPINKNMAVDGVMTWCTVFYRDILEKIKDNGCYYDERFYPGGGEDYDLMCRIYDLKGDGERHRVVGVYNSWAYHHWFGTKTNRSHEAFFSNGDNKPKTDQSLRYSDVDGKYKRKPEDPVILKNGIECNSNWDLWGRKNREIPIPPCTKLKL